MIPKIGRFYYINYEDKAEPEGSYFGIARCVAVFDKDTEERPIKPLYEFEHPDPKGNMVLSVYYAEEVMMEASKP